MSVIGPRPGLWNQDILTAERDKYNGKGKHIDEVINGVKVLLCAVYT